MTFALDPRLQRETIPVGDLDLSRLLLMNDATYPWLVLVPRRDGATYDETWETALALRPAWVVIASWNEWHEGSEIEPSKEHGDRYLQSTRWWAARLRERT